MNVRGISTDIPRRGRHGGRQRGRTALALGLAALLAALLAAGCEEKRRQAVGQDGLVRPIAVVNNEPIAYETFQNEYQLFLTRWDRFIGNDQRKKQELKEVLLERGIEQKLLDQEARRKGITVTDAALNERALELLSAPGEEEGEPAAQIPEDVLASWTQDLRRRMVHARLIREEVLSRIRVTPAEMHAYYERHKAEFKLPERVRARHIAVGSKSLYNKVRRLLRRDNDFTELVQQYSITPDRFEDGDLGYVKRGVLPEEFDEVIFNLEKVGSVAAPRTPVKTEIGYHIFKLEGRKPAEELDYREAIPVIRERILHDKQDEAYRDWLEGLRRKATIYIDHQLLTAE